MFSSSRMILNQMGGWRRDQAGDIRKARVVQRGGDLRSRRGQRAAPVRRRGGGQSRNPPSQACQEIAVGQSRVR